MKKTIIVGNLGKDAECREGKGGHKFVTFSVAYGKRETTDSAGNPVEETLWCECEIYVKPESSAEGLVKALTKGRHIYLEATDKVEVWLNRENEPAARIVYRVQKFEI